MRYEPVDASIIGNRPDLVEWRVVGDTLNAGFDAGSYMDAAAFVRVIAELAEAMDHHPDVDLRYPAHVRVSTTTHATGGLTLHDIELARRISAVAPSHGLRADSQTIPKSGSDPSQTAD